MLNARLLAVSLLATLAAAGCGAPSSPWPATSIVHTPSTSASPHASYTGPTNSFTDLDYVKQTVALTWVPERDRSGVRFAMPDEVPPESAQRIGRQGEVFTYSIGAHDAVSVSVLRSDAGRAGARTYAHRYFDALVRRFKDDGAGDARVTDEKISTYRGSPAADGRVRFTPTFGQRIPVIWFVRMLLGHRFVVFLQTVVFPAVHSPDYEVAARLIHRHLLSSVRGVS